MTDALTPRVVVDGGIASVPAGVAHLQPGMALRVAVPTQSGGVRLIHRRTRDAVQHCEIWGGDFPDPDRAGTVLWRDAGSGVKAWLGRVARRPDAVDLRDDPQIGAALVCAGTGEGPVMPGAASFRFEDETMEDLPRGAPDGGIVASVSRCPKSSCADLKGRM